MWVLYYEEKMGHDKLRKFAENETFSCLLQPDASKVLDKSGDPSEGLRLHGHPVKGHWNEVMFKDLEAIQKHRERSGDSDGRE